jgi:hypothetical protein
MRVFFVLCAGASLATISTAALAAPPIITNIGGCANTTNPAALACDGFYTTNLIAGDPIDLAAQHDALGNLGYNFDITTFDALTGGTFNGATSLFSFGTTLFGITYLGMHFGDAGTGLGDRSVFYKFDFGAGGSTGITLDTAGYSNSRIYASGNPTPTPRSAVPEPATWALMLLGFGGVGMAMRRSRRDKSVLAQIA